MTAALPVSSPLVPPAPPAPQALATPPAPQALATPPAPPPAPPPARGGIAATATLVVEAGGGARRPRIRWSHAWPVILRPTGDDQVHLVHGAGGPLGGDRLGLDVTVGPGARLRVRSAGATLVQPGLGPGSAHWDTTLRLGAGARLDWSPEPTIVTDGAAFETSLDVTLAAGASATVREIVVLGRHGRAGGRYRGRSTVTVDGRPLLAQTTVLDGADAALRGPAGTAGARAVGTLLLVGLGVGAGAGGGAGAGVAVPAGAGEEAGVRWAWTALDGPGALLIAVGDPGPVTALLEREGRLAAPAR